MAKTVEELVFDALRSLVADRCYPDRAPPKAGRPYIVYQAVGGVGTDTLEGRSDLQNARMQIAVWADTRLAVARLILAVAPALSTGIKSASFAAEAQAWTLDLQQSVQIGQPVSVYEEDTGLYGSRLDFSIWYYP